MEITENELLAYTDIAVIAAKAGGGVLQRMFGTSLKVDYKGDIDLVTDADKAAETAIIAVLRRHCPAHGLLAEEGDYGQSVSPWRWIIDPLDGTTNFAHGFPVFAVSVALEYLGKIVVGVVYQPMTGELFVATLGHGATLNGVAIKVSSVERLDQSLLATGFPYDFKVSSVNNFDHFYNFQLAAQACRRPGAASYDLACVAAGRFDGYWELKLKPWDVAAGALLVTEAGGCVSDFSGGRFDHYAQEYLASNGLIHADMIGVLRQGTGRI